MVIVISVLLRMVAGLAMGALGALVLLGVGALRALFVVATGSTVSTEGMWPGVAWYALGCMVAGAVIGLLFPLHRLRGGKYILGVIEGCIVVGFIARMEDGPFTQWDGSTFIMIATLGALFGVAGAYGLRD